MKRFLLFFGIFIGSLFLHWLSDQTFSPVSPVNAASYLDTKPAVAYESSCQISNAYPDDIQQWCHLITKYSLEHGIDPNLIAALIWQESGGNPEIISRDGAVGLMQVMPRDGKGADFMCINGPCFANRPTTEELKNPEFNITWGINFLRQLQHNHGTIRDALKAYGPANVDYYYADKVISIYQSY